MQTQFAGTKVHLQVAGHTLNGMIDMKPISFKISAPRARRHRALFDQDLPFRGRVEQPKTVYQRRPKHRNRDEQ